MKRIPLTRGKFAIVDDENFDELSKHKWYFLHTGYAVREMWKDGKATSILMHRQLLGLKKNQIVDHKNRNGLDNRKSNLRHCTHSQNHFNQLKSRNNTSGFKGVFFHKRNGLNPWEARMQVDGIARTIGYFKTAKLAAKAYDSVAKKMQKEFMVPNLHK